MSETHVDLRSPAAARRVLERLASRREVLAEQRDATAAELARATAFLARADAVSAALEALGEQLFGELTRTIEDQLTIALQEVLEQPLALKVERKFTRGAMSLAFHVERGGHAEDILDGQGGSVANVLSVGLRLLALTTLDGAAHRRLLVLDEQDCWLRPDLVPRLVNIVHRAGRELGFQVLMISHHDASAFDRYADKLYRISPGAEGVEVREVKPDGILKSEV